jgi:hypothetical protein
VKEFEAQGLGVAAITYDKPEALRHFAERAGLRFPLLADEGSKVIRAFGILNDTVPADNFAYGIPYPGVYVVDASGVVKSKYFEDRYQERFTAGSILIREFPAAGGGEGREIETPHLKLRAWASDASVVAESRLTLVLEVDLPERMHVYAPGVQGYIPIDWKLEESKGFKQHPVVYPASRTLRLEAIKETVPVYEGRVKLLRDVTLAGQNALAPLLAGGSELKIAGTFRYQACDDKICYQPRTVPVEWTVRVAAYDRQRVPAELRKQ